MRIRLIVKGSRLEAERAASLRDIPTTHELTIHDSTVLNTQLPNAIPIVEWFCAPTRKLDAYGFEPGTLLLYQFPEDEKRGGRPRKEHSHA